MIRDVERSGEENVGKEMTGRIYESRVDAVGIKE